MRHLPDWQGHPLRSLLTNPGARPILGTLLVVAVMLPAWWQAGNWYRGRLEESQRADIARHLQHSVEMLTGDMQRRLALAEGLSPLVVMENQDLVDREPAASRQMERAVGSLLSGVDGMYAVSVETGGTHHTLYQKPGAQTPDRHAQIIAENPAVRGDLERAVQSRLMTLSEPGAWGREDLRWIAWRPVFDEELYHGLVVMEMDLLPVLGRLAEEGPPDWIEMAVRNQSAQLLFGSQQVFDANPITATVKLAEGQWELAAIPTGGWEDGIQVPLTLFRMASLLVIALLSGIVYLAVHQHAELTLVVSRKSTELSEANQRLASSIARRRHTLALYLIAAAAVGNEGFATMLRRSLDAALMAVEGVAGAISLVEERTGDLKVEATRGTTPANEEWIASHSTSRALACRVLASHRTMTLADFHEDSLSTVRSGGLSGSLAAVPIRVRGMGMGVLSVMRERSHPFSSEELAMLAAMGEQIAESMESARRFANSRTEGVQEERHRLARELHDSLVQLLYGMTLSAEGGFQAAIDGSVSGVQKQFQEIAETAQQALKEARLLLHDLGSADLKQMGLAGALRQRTDSVETRAGVKVRLQIDDSIRLPDPIEQELYRIALEALNNSLKHSGASTLSISLKAERGQLLLEIADNGKGFDPVSAAGNGGMGLANMRERAQRAGASLRIVSAPGAGTVVRASARLFEHPAETASMSGKSNGTGGRHR